MYSMWKKYINEKEKTLLNKKMNSIHTVDQSSRTEITRFIYIELQRILQNKPISEEKLLMLARRFEENIFNHARSREDYLDTTRIRQKMRELVMRIIQTNPKKRKRLED